MLVTHIPVLRDEVLGFIKPKPEDVYVDATVGLGGHSLGILKETHPTSRLIGIDLDLSALEIAKNRLNAFHERISLIKGNFSDLKQILREQGIHKINAVIFDLGVSSLQLDTPHRGFSFQNDAPLDMRMDVRMPRSALQIIDESPPEELINIFKEYGEERYAKQIAYKIVDLRKNEPIKTTQQLSQIVESIYSRNKKHTRHNNKRKIYNGRKIHPSTRIFQALRIEVNDELNNLRQGLDDAVALLESDGCICVISFHSLEDRIVKQYFQLLSKNCICPPKTPICICEHEQKLKFVTKKPILPTVKEINSNPRARSAKLRVALKI